MLLRSEVFLNQKASKLLNKNIKIEGEFTFTPLIIKKYNNKPEYKGDEYPRNNEIMDLDELNYEGEDKENRPIPFGDRLYNYRLKYKEKKELLKETYASKEKQYPFNSTFFKKVAPQSYNSYERPPVDSIRKEMNLIQRIEDSINGVQTNQTRQIRHTRQEHIQDIRESDEGVFTKNYLEHKTNSNQAKVLNMPLKGVNKSSNSENIIKLNTNSDSQISNKMVQINNISDTQLLEMANHMITTDQSLDEFQNNKNLHL